MNPKFVCRYYEATAPWGQQINYAGLAVERFVLKRAASTDLLEAVETVSNGGTTSRPLLTLTFIRGAQLHLGGRQSFDALR
jgi:hypothetical protein